MTIRSDRHCYFVQLQYIYCQPQFNVQTDPKRIVAKQEVYMYVYILTLSAYLPFFINAMIYISNKKAFLKITSVIFNFSTLYK